MKPRYSKQGRGEMIKRTQFTRYDSELHPEITLNREYLELENISGVICSYGYQRIKGTKYRWIKIAEAKEG